MSSDLRYWVAFTLMILSIFFTLVAHIKRHYEFKKLCKRYDDAIKRYDKLCEKS